MDCSNTHARFDLAAGDCVGMEDHTITIDDQFLTQSQVACWNRVPIVAETHGDDESVRDAECSGFGEDGETRASGDDNGGATAENAADRDAESAAEHTVPAADDQDDDAVTGFPDEWACESNGWRAFLKVHMAQWESF